MFFVDLCELVVKNDLRQRTLRIGMPRWPPDQPDARSKFNEEKQPLRHCNTKQRFMFGYLRRRNVSRENQGTWQACRWTAILTALRARTVDIWYFSWILRWSEWATIWSISLWRSRGITGDKLWWVWRVCQDCPWCGCCCCCAGKATFRIEGDDVSEGGFEEGTDDGLWNIVWCQFSWWIWKADAYLYVYTPTPLYRLPLLIETEHEDWLL